MRRRRHGRSDEREFPLTPGLNLLIDGAAADRVLGVLIINERIIDINVKLLLFLGLLGLRLLRDFTWCSDLLLRHSDIRFGPPHQN